MLKKLKQKIVKKIKNEVMNEIKSELSEEIELYIQRGFHNIFDDGINLDYQSLSWISDYKASKLFAVKEVLNKYFDNRYNDTTLDKINNEIESKEFIQKLIEEINKYQLKK